MREGGRGREEEGGKEREGAGEREREQKTIKFNRVGSGTSKHAIAFSKLC